LTQSNNYLDAYLVGSEYSLYWYQPKYSTTYCATCLRRYNGDVNGGTKVRAYCVSGRNLSSVGLFGVSAADVTGAVGLVSLSGATTLLAAGSALIFGSTMLAF